MGRPAFVLNAKASQIGRTLWLAFTALALSMAIPGIAPYVELLRTPCDGADCFSAQLSLKTAQAWLEGGENLLLFALLQSAIVLTIDAVLLSTAAFLIWRKASNAASVLAAFVGTALATSTLSQALAHTDQRFWLPAHVVLFVQMAGLVPLFCLLPDGHIRPPGMRWVALTYVVVSLVYLMPSYPEWLAPGTTAYALWLDLAVVSVLIVIASLAYRTRHAASSAHQGQMMWVLAAIGLATPVALLGVPLPFVNTSLVPVAAVWSEPFLVLVIGLFLAVGSITCGLIALLNYEPLDADVLVNRAIVYVALTGFVVGTYVLIVGYLSTVFHSDNVLLSLIASGLIATFLQPVRARLQRAVNRLTYGERDEPYRVLARLGQRLEVAVEPASALPLTVETIARALKLPYVAIVLERDGFLQIVAAHGTAQEGVAHFPLVHAGQAIGELVAGTRASNESLTPADQRLLQDLARQTSVAAHAALLTTNLEQARVRLVTERGEARRQLGSDLHDGVGHQLVGLSRQVERAMTSADDPAVARSLLTEINHRLVDLTKQVRGLAQRLSTELESLGLTGALRERAAEHSDLRIYVDAPDALPRLPAEIEMAAYYITLEALTNVDKHAAANACQVQLRLAQDRAVLGTSILKLDIRDNGQGMPIKTREGLGLLSMRARAADVGGTCRIEPNHGGGTAVIVRIPCPIKLE